MTFVLYDDQEEFIKRSKAVIKKFALQTDTQYDVKSFHKYDEEFEKLIHDGKNNKIYIHSQLSFKYACRFCQIKSHPYPSAVIPCITFSFLIKFLFV